MSDFEHARSLLRMAQRDLNALRGMINPAVDPTQVFFSDEVFGFHAQQAAEKSLKAWIASLGNRQDWCDRVVRSCEFKPVMAAETPSRRWYPGWMNSQVWPA